MKTSGARALWLNEVANAIMDGGSNPPSIELLKVMVPPKIGTGINDGHVTAAIVFGEDRRDDFKAGQDFIVDEMVGVLRSEGYVNGDDKALRWLKPLDGTWRIPIDEKEYAVFGQRERRMSRDRGMLGETGDNGFLVGPPGVLSSGKSRPFEVEVVGPRGGSERKSFQVHPLALAIPPMTEAERETLRESITRDGVKVPIVLFQGKVLDGRHRFYFASALKKSVRVEEFKGTEDEARRHVAILNLHRRHLTGGQKLAASVALFGEEARKETKEALEKGRILGNQSRSPSRTKMSETGKPPLTAAELQKGGRWEEIVARKAREAGITGVTPAGVKAMKEVMDAPKTLAKVQSGEIPTVTRAVEEARKEKGQPEGSKALAHPSSAFKRLGQCIEHLTAILSDSDIEIGRLPDRVGDRLDEVERLVPRVRQVLRERKVIG